MLATGIKLKKCENIIESSSKCIICQSDENIASVAHEIGKRKIQETARSRRDVIFDRLQRFGEDFVYHTRNACYKFYTHKKYSSNINSSSKNSHNIILSPISSSSDITSESSARNAVCVVCGCKAYKKNFKKFRITHSASAKSFIDAKTYFNDDVNDRTIYLTCVEDVLNAFVFCHKECIRSYNGKYKAASENVNQNTDDLTLNTFLKHTTIIDYLETLTSQLKAGVGFTLTDVRKNIKTLHDVDASNRYIKKCLQEVFGDTIRFSKSKAANVSTMFFHSSVQVEDIAEVLRSMDYIKDCGETLRDAFKNYDFGLSNEFTDANNLQNAWQKIEIPQPIISFFAALCNFKESDYENLQQFKQQNQNVDDNGVFGSISNSKCLKITALFQIMHYIITNGSQRTPLHIMNGLATHDTCRSSTLIKSLNHIGVSISYDEVLRHRNDLARYTVQSCQESIPIPSHLDVDTFTLAAFDNFDHNEATFTGLGSSHDTVSVLFQDKPTNELKKPKLTETNIKHGSRTFQEDLSCQKIMEFSNPSNTITLPENYISPKGTFTMNSEKLELIQQKEFAWELCRFNLESDSQDNSEQITPTWAAFNSILSEEPIRPTQIVGFLPVIPRPVTEYSTVYTALHNFLKVLRQLKQSKLPVTCDEGVYRIARHITLIRPTEFEDIILLLGPFHLAKIAFACIGKYLKGSGADSIFTESSVFGPAVTESVLKGTNYVRAFKGYVLLSETLRKLQLKEFFKIYDIRKYEAEINKLQELKQGFAGKRSEFCKEKFTEFARKPSILQKDFETFIKKRCIESELFKYWNNVIYLISLAKDLVRADRESNWLLHLETIQKLLPVFAVFDRPNYLRWCSIYLEDMRRLESTAPEIYNEFMAGRCSVKRSTRSFSAVGPDMCLEQTINRSTKSTSGVIGSTRNKSYVTEWELIYHEVLAVSNVYREITNVSSTNNHELRFHHEYTSSEMKQMETHINNMTEFILRHENPFISGSNTLRNIITQEEADPGNVQEILNVMDTGNKAYEEYRRSRFIEKTQTISSVIHNIKTPLFCSKIKGQPDDNIKSDKKSYTSAQKVIDLARERQFNLARLFTFDLVNNEFLFDRYGDLTKPNSITNELDKLTLDLSKSFKGNINNCYIVVVMQYLKKMSVTKKKTFGDLAQSFFNFISDIVPTDTKRIDFIFNSYDGFTPKNYYKNQIEQGSIKIHKIEDHTPLPVKMDMFWSSIENEKKIQNFIKSFITKANKFLQGRHVFFSAINDDAVLECGSYEINGTGTIVLRRHPDLECIYHDESMRVMPHVNHATKNGYEKIVVLPADTELIVPAIHYWRKFNEYGLKELWIRIGGVTISKLMPIHSLVEKLGSDTCDNLIAIHMLTGSQYYTSKFGTKAAALKISDYTLLQDFGHVLHDTPRALEDVVENAERFLIKLIKKDGQFRSMDDLRMWHYHHANNSSLENMPPTTRMTREHILRAIYWTHLQLTCLLKCNNKLDPKNYGYIEIEGLYQPKRNIMLYPPETELVPSCNCGKCARKTCSCFDSGLSCCSFCKCRARGDGNCQNSHSNRVGAKEPLQEINDDEIKAKKVGNKRSPEESAPKIDVKKIKITTKLQNNKLIAEKQEKQEKPIRKSNRNAAKKNK